MATDSVGDAAVRQRADAWRRWSGPASTTPAIPSCASRSADRAASTTPATQRGSRKSTEDAAARAAAATATLERKLLATNDVAAAMPFNAAKASEFSNASRKPPQGAMVADVEPLVSGSTITETTPSDKLGSGDIAVGVNHAGGDLDHVRVDDSAQALTTNQGVRIADNQDSLKAGLRGPTLLEDFILREKITHFDHERIPERIVHARGSGAHGYFESYADHADLTRASLLSAAGKRTPVFVRFSTVAGERGSTDTTRDVRGFAVKFYTDEGRGQGSCGKAGGRPWHGHAGTDAAGDIPPALPTSEPDPGLVVVDADAIDAGVASFVAALTQRRHFEREVDPPTV